MSETLDLDKLRRALEFTHMLTKRDLEHKTIFELLASAGEELGELARELKIAHKTYGNTYKTPDEGPKAEAVDLLICALSIFYGEGGTDSELIDLLHKKLNKWFSTPERTT